MTVSDTSVVFVKVNVVIINYNHFLKDQTVTKQITEQKLAFREKHNTQDQREEMHFVMAGHD